ncbi:MAG TPA: tetratricopeptide repeat protein [Casimicrobiaceae bacterium]|nr:tetratricopeptide repeat protein [Casimicrobiaceae bacterium]
MKSTVVAKALADAFELHKQGRLADAEAGYRAVLTHAPDEPDALHRLGLIAHQRGQENEALELIERAVGLAAANPIYHNDAALVLHAQGRVDEAIGRYQTALALAPRFARAHNGLGIAQKDRGRLDEAERSFRTAVSLEPRYVDAHVNLGNILCDLGRREEAVQTYRSVLAIGARSPYLWFNLGNALTDLRAFDEAVDAYRNVVSLVPDFANARVRLGDALLSLERADDALAMYASALAIEETPDAIAGFVNAFEEASLASADPRIDAMALRALTVPWARPAELAGACMRLLANDAGLRPLIARALDTWPARLDWNALFGDREQAVFGNVLLRTLLESTPACDSNFERFLTLARAAMLDDANARDLDDRAFAFACALARQCFINDYVFSSADDEMGRARALRDGVSRWSGRGEAPPAIDLAIVAAYFPLHSLVNAESLLAHAWPEPVDALLTQQVREPRQERDLRGSIRRPTGIDDRVSTQVRDQYEEHPYPKWVTLRPSNLAALLASHYAGALGAVTTEAAAARSSLAGAAPRSVQVLIAGCGTGQESIELAQSLPQATVLAVDLSLASLAYATRKARDLGVGNVEHAQADILKIGSLRRTFDFISCVGVLHHLDEPIRGLRELVRVLAPNGAMLLGLYSERARADVIAAKAFIAERGYAGTNADIRRCRQEMMSRDEGQRFATLARRRDFYTTSECRDLLFHACEHRFTLPQVRRLVDEAGLSFAGFVLSVPHARRYLRQFPSDPAMADLDNFERFEAQFPDLFAGMYIFRVRKRA